jgi:hypothetical protein
MKPYMTLKICTWNIDGTPVASSGESIEANRENMASRGFDVTGREPSTVIDCPCFGFSYGVGAVDTSSDIS